MHLLFKKRRWFPVSHVLSLSLSLCSLLLTRLVILQERKLWPLAMSKLGTPFSHLSVCRNNAQILLSAQFPPLTQPFGTMKYMQKWNTWFFPLDQIFCNPKNVWSLAISHLALTVWAHILQSPSSSSTTLYIQLQKELQIIASTLTNLNEWRWTSWFPSPVHFLFLDAMASNKPARERYTFIQTRYISKGAIITFQSTRHRFSLAVQFLHIGTRGQPPLWIDSVILCVKMSTWTEEQIFFRKKCFFTKKMVKVLSKRDARSLGKKLSPNTCGFW